MTIFLFVLLLFWLEKGKRKGGYLVFVHKETVWWFRRWVIVMGGIVVIIVVIVVMPIVNFLWWNTTFRTTITNNHYNLILFCIEKMPIHFPNYLY